MKKITCFFSFILILCITILSCIYYAFQIEPYRLDIHTYDIGNNKQKKMDVKIVQFSDTHIKKDFTYQNLHKVVEAINKQQVDIVIFTGDLYDNYAKYNDDANIINELKSIQANYAKLAIWGNRDYGGGASRQYENIMTQAGFTLLKNENWYISLQNNKTILFTGLDDSMLGNEYMNASTKLYEYDYSVLLSHEPDIVDAYQHLNYDLILSGHSHGGQINVPFLPIINKKAVSITSYSSKFTGGMYDLKNGKKLYVNTGLGTTHISARLGVPPEITVFHLYM